MVINNFIDKWYIQPIIQNQGYNLVNTLTYALLFILVVWGLYEYYFKKEKVAINRNFIIALFGWILFGSSLRAAQATGIYNTYLFVTPLIFVVVFIVSFLMLLFYKYLEENYNLPYYTAWGVSGYTLALYNLIRLPLQNWYALFLVLIISFSWLILLLIARKIIPKFMSWWNLGVLQAHLFDASSTFVALYFFSGFKEIHVLGGFLTENYGAWTMFPMKLIVVSLVLYLIDKYSKDKLEKRYIKMIILLLGLATGLADLLKILSFNL